MLTTRSIIQSFQFPNHVFLQTMFLMNKKNKPLFCNESLHVVWKNTILLLVYVEILWALLLGKGVFEQVCLNKLVQTTAFKKNQNSHLQNGHYIRTFYWEDYLSLGLVWQSKLQSLLHPQVKRKKFYPYFFFCYYGSKLLHNAPFYLNRTNYKRIPCLIEDLNLLQ